MIIKKYGVDLQAKQINKYDERWYEITAGKNKVVGVFINATEIISAMPKPKWFYDWIKRMGFNADVYRDEAGEIGSEVHWLISETLNGKTVKFQDIEHIEAWEKYLDWCQWYKDTKPGKLLYCEKIVFSVEDRWAGTLDAIFEKDGKIIVYDWKSGNSPGFTLQEQMSAYSKAVIEMELVNRVDEMHCVHLSRQTYKKYGYGDIKVEGKWEQIYKDYFIPLMKVYWRANEDKFPKYLVYPSELNLKTIAKKDLITNKYPKSEFLESLVDTKKKIKTNKTKGNK